MHNDTRTPESRTPEAGTYETRTHDTHDTRERDARTPDEIERDIVRERAELSGTLDSLQDRFSVDGIVREVSDQLRLHGGDIGRTVSTAVKDNPMAVALTGVGLAWMIFGPRQPLDRGYRATSDRDGYRDSLYRDATRVPPASETYASRRPMTEPGGYGAMPQRNLPGWARDVDDDHDTASSETSTGQKVKGYAMAAKDSAGSAAGSARDGAQSAGSSMADAGKSAMGSISDAAQAGTDAAARLRDRLAEGTEQFSEEARHRIVAARESAMHARDRAAQAFRSSSAQAGDLYDRQPLVAGLLAVAAGAAIGAALPRTKMEDDYFGDESDHLFHEAERIYHEERDKAERVMNATLDEAKAVAAEGKTAAKDAAPGAKSAAHDAMESVKDAAQRVKDRAVDEAEKEKLGSPKV